MKRCAVAILAMSGFLCRASGQEANTGIDVPITVTAQAVQSGDLGDAPRHGSDWVGGFRAVAYPTIKLSRHWSVSGAIQAVSRPYYYEDFTSIGHGARARVLQANLAYSRTWGTRSVVIRAGQMVSAFGSFLMRYDDAENPLLNAPQAYGYYKPITVLGLAGAEVDFTQGKWDGRLQFANSSPANPRSIFAKDQYANWAGGAGYTIRQGLRVGFSGYRGPYLDRQYAYFFPGEANPISLPATAIGVDGEWAAGHWNMHGEWQHFVMAYAVIPTFRQSTGYWEVKRVLNPRWFVAVRAGYLHTSFVSGAEAYEGSVGFRPNGLQIIKAGYAVSRSQQDGTLDKTFVVQVVTAIHPPSLVWQ
jgi:hypothetical protein